MSEAVVAKRYADALFQLGNEKGTLEQLVEEFRIVKKLFQENNRLPKFMEHPRVSVEKKKQFIDDVFNAFSSDTVNTLKLLGERHRFASIVFIVDELVHMVNEAKGIAEATVYTTRDLTNAEKEAIENTFTKRLQKQAIKLETVVDPSVLGGIKLRVGNTIYDGTISGKLKRIERNITAANE